MDFFSSNVFFSIISIWFWAVIMPGADMFLVIRNAIHYGKQCAYFSAFGIILGTLVWLIVGFFFVHILSQTSFFEIVQILGGSYLIYMASQIFLSLKQNTNINSNQAPKNHTTPLKSLAYGILTNLSNPKPPIFISIILSKIPQELDFYSSMLLLLLMTFIPLCWFYFVVRIFSIERFFKTFMRFSKWIDRIVMYIFGLFGLSLMIEGVNQLLD